MENFFVYMTASSRDEARMIARALLEERLVACANILAGHESLYWWQGEIEEAREVAVIFKTRADLFESLVVRVKALHSYDVPCVVAWPIAHGYGPFMDWITAEASGRL